MPLKVDPKTWLSEVEDFYSRLQALGPVPGGPILFQGWAVAEVGFLPEVFHVEGLPGADNDTGPGGRKSAHIAVAPF